MNNNNNNYSPITANMRPINICLPVQITIKRGFLL